MQKLVIVTDVDGGCCSYASHIPVMYVSADALLADIEKAIVTCLSDGQWKPPVFGLRETFIHFITKKNVAFCEEVGRPVFEIRPGVFRTYTLPDVYALDQWFEQYREDVQ